MEQFVNIRLGNDGVSLADAARTNELLSRIRAEIRENNESGCLSSVSVESARFWKCLYNMVNSIELTHRKLM